MKLSKFSEQDDATLYVLRKDHLVRLWHQKKRLKSISVNLTLRQQAKLQQKY